MQIQELAYKVEDLQFEILKARGIERIIYEGISEDSVLTGDHMWALTVLDDLMCLLTDRADMLTNEAFSVWAGMKEEANTSMLLEGGEKIKCWDHM